MNEPERLRAWDLELKAAHQRLRDALRLARDGAGPRNDLLLYCRGFCAALEGHHRSEGDALFPELVRERPDLAPVVERLMEDHRAISSLLLELTRALDRDEGEDLSDRLDGIAAIMESHFAYEERSIGAALGALAPGVASRESLLGPL